MVGVTHRKRRSPGGGLVRRLLVVAAGLLLLWLSFGVTANFAGERVFSPGTLLGWWPWGANAHVQDALLRLSRARSAADVAGAERVARTALMREPINVLAVRVIALSRVSFGDAAGARRAFAYAESLSRRDLPTELFNIENAVRRGDIDSALRHYDHALRTSPDAAGILLPVLTQASADPAVGPRLRAMVARRPPWALGLGEVAASQLNDGPALYALARALRLDLNIPNEARLAGGVVRRLVDLGANDLALRYYAGFVPGAAGKLLRGGDFERDSIFVPLDWQLREDANLGAEVEPRAEGGHVLRLYARTDRGGDVATQLLFLRPGQYLLSGEGGDTASDPNDRPVLVLRCRRGQTFASVTMPQAGEGRSARFRETVTVPGECMPQEIVIRTAPGTDTDAWVDNLALTPASGRASGAAR